MTKKTVCQLDEGGYYVGAAEADLSPLEPDVWLMPGGCVDAPLPEVPEGKRARWDGAAFQMEEIAPGELEAPPPTREDSIVEAWRKIKIERDRRTQAGGFQVGAHWFHSDTFSRTQQLGLLMLGAAMPADVQWKTMSGEFVAMTPELAQQIFAAAAASDIAIFAAAEAHRTAMEASADPATYEFTAGWPPVFEG